MEKQYERGEIKLLSMEEYAKIVVDMFEHLPDDIIVHRLTGEAPEEELIAPEWCLPSKKQDVLKAINDEFERRTTVDIKVYG